MVRVVRPTVYSRLVGALVYLLGSALLFACGIKGSSPIQQVGFSGCGFVFLSVSSRLALFGGVRVNREAKFVTVPRLLWGKRKIPFCNIVGIGTSVTVFLIGEWGNGATVVTLSVKRDSSDKLREVKCYSLCGYALSSAVNARLLELRDAIGEWNRISRVDWFAGSPITDTHDDE